MSDSVIFRMNDGAILSGKRETIGRLSDDFKTYGKTPRFTHVATVAKIKKESRPCAKYEIGKRCLVLSFDALDDKYSLLFISTNADGRITEIEIFPEGDNRYVINLDIAGEPNKENIWIRRDRDDWLRLFKTNYEQFNFDGDEFYFGMEPDATLNLQWEFEAIQGREEIYRFFTNEAEKIEKTGGKPTAEIVEFSSWPYRSALSVTVGKIKTLVTIETSRRRRIGKIEIGMKDSIKTRDGDKIASGEVKHDEYSPKAKTVNDLQFIYADWPAEELTSGCELKNYVRKLKEKLVGAKMSGTKTAAFSFCVNEGDDDTETWNEWRMGSCGFAAPFCVNFGETRLKLHFGASSKVKIVLNGGISSQGDGSVYHKVDFPNVTGQIIKDIVATTFDVVKEDESAYDGDYIENLFFIMESGFVLCFYGRGGKTYVCERPIDKLRIYPTDARVYITSDKYREGLECSPSFSFVPCLFSEAEPEFKPWSYEDKMPDSETLFVLDNGFDVLHLAIRAVLPEFDMYDSTLVPIEKFRAIINAWGTIFESASIDELFERLCGVDYVSHRVLNESLLYMFNNMGTSIWGKRDAERHVYDDFLVWFERYNEKCSHIKIMGL